MKVGDRVIVNGEYAGIEFVNEPRRIIGFTNGDVCVEFDNYMGIPFHSYNSILSEVETKNGYCWFASPEMITKEITMEERIEELEQEDANTYKKTGRAFDTRDKAEKARDIMVKHDIILKYVIDHAPNYEPNEYDCASIFFCRDSGKWKRVLASDTDECIGTILMPIKIADKLADDLNNDRIDFN